MTADKTTDDWVEIDGDEIVLTENAPDWLLEEAEENHEYFSLKLNFTVALLAAGYEGDELEEFDLSDLEELANRERQYFDEAIEAGDMDSVEEHNQSAKAFESLIQQRREWLYNGDNA